MVQSSAVRTGGQAHGKEKKNVIDIQYMNLDVEDGGRNPLIPKPGHLLTEDDVHPSNPKAVRWNIHDFLLGTVVGQIFSLLIGAVVIICTGATAWRFFGGNDDYNTTWIHSFWFAWGMFFDPGTQMGFAASESLQNKSIAAAFSVIGFLYNLLMLGLFVELARKTLYRCYKKGNRIVQNKHTILLGWSEKTIFILKELLHASENRKLASNKIVILADEDEDFMTQRISYNFPKKSDRCGQKIIVFRGSPYERDDLVKVSATSAREIIFLGQSEHPRSSDQEAIQSVVALASLPEEPCGSIIASVRVPEIAPVIDAVFERAEGIITRAAVKQIMCLKVVQPVIGDCFESLASFIHGEELYCKKLYELGLNPHTCRNFGDACRLLGKGICIGINSPDMQTVIAPADTHQIGSQDKLVVLASSEMQIMGTEKKKFGIDENHPTSPATTALVPKQAPGRKDIIIIGWTYDMLGTLETLDKYMPMGSEVHILAEVNKENRQEQCQTVKFQNITKFMHYAGNCTSVESLKKLPLTTASAVFILADGLNNDEDANACDASSLACTVSISDLMNKLHCQGEGRLICEVLSSRTQRMLSRRASLNSRAAFFHSNAVEAGLVAMASADRTVYNTLMMLLQPGDNGNLACVPAKEYLKGWLELKSDEYSVNFRELWNHARKHNDLLLGWMHATNRNLCLNPPDRDKYVSLKDNDHIIVIHNSK